MEKAVINLRAQRLVAAVSVILLAIKLIAYYSTHSVSILTDALESIVNVAAGFIGLYSLSVAAKPRDADHPYGHGKAEFLSAAVEGTMIGAAAVFILYKAILSLIHPIQLEKIDTGIWLVGITALVNLGLGFYCLSIGRKNDSMALTASGKHLLTDTISTGGIIIGLVLMYFTGYVRLDAIVAIIVGLIILFTSYRILRTSIAGIMDEADKKILTRMVEMLNANKQVNWVDLHNLRVIKYGAVLHVDCHFTVPWYLNVHEAHAEIDALAALVRGEFGESVELFVHSDGCLAFQCPICNKFECPVRKHNFVERKTWTLENVSRNKKHDINT